MTKFFIRNNEITGICEVIADNGTDKVWVTFDSSELTNAAYGIAELGSYLNAWINNDPRPNPEPDNLIDKVRKAIDRFYNRYIDLCPDVRHQSRVIDADWA